MRRILLIITMAWSWMTMLGQGADPHMYMRAEVGTPNLLSSSDIRGIQFGAEGGVRLFKGLTLGLAMDYYTSGFNSEIDAEIKVTGYPGNYGVTTTLGNADFHSRSCFMGRLVIGYDVLNPIPGNRWVAFSPEFGFGVYRRTETAYVRDGQGYTENMYCRVNEKWNLDFTVGGRIDVNLPRNWAVGVYARYYTHNKWCMSGLAVTKSF